MPYQLLYAIRQIASTSMEILQGLICSIDYQLSLMIKPKTIRFLDQMTSIGHIIHEDSKKHTEKDHAKELFVRRILPKFLTEEFHAREEYQKHSKYKALVRVLEDWNKCIDIQNYDYNIEAQLLRNQYIFTSLKSLSTVADACFAQILDQLYQWYRRNSKNQPQIMLKMKRFKQKDDDWIVRDTYRSNLPLQINSYQRKLFNYDGVKDKLKFQKRDHEKQVLAMHQWDKYKANQREMRNIREKKEVQFEQKCFKTSKTRFGEQSCKNFYKGRFQNNKKWMSATATTSPSHSQSFDLIKSLRIKSSFGQRSRYVSLQKPSPDLSSIQGLSLMVNPFENKQKLKKKRNKK